MCPDRDIVSAWADGEVPSPWSETIERHVRSCAACSEVAASIARTKSLFSADSDEASAPGSFAAQAKARVFAKIAGDAPMMLHRREPFLSRRFAVPLPAAAAAALAMAVLSFALAGSARANTELRIAMARAIEATPVATSGIGMDSIVDFITKQNSGVNINITLPAEAFGGSAGEPLIIREADYNPGSRR